jgi:hypothetical protein
MINIQDGYFEFVNKFLHILSRLLLEGFIHATLV